MWGTRTTTWLARRSRIQATNMLTTIYGHRLGNWSTRQVFCRNMLFICRGALLLSRLNILSGGENQVPGIKDHKTWGKKSKFLALCTWQCHDTQTGTFTFFCQSSVSFLPLLVWIWMLGRLHAPIFFITWLDCAFSLNVEPSWDNQ